MYCSHEIKYLCNNYDVYIVPTGASSQGKLRKSVLPENAHEHGNCAKSPVNTNSTLLFIN